MRQLYKEMVKPIATRNTKGAWYRVWRIVSLDGSTVSVADSLENHEAFGRSRGSRGDSAFPILRFAALVENGTRVIFAMVHGGYEFTSEKELARQLIGSLSKDMLCLCDRYYLGYDFWKLALETGAALLWRAKTGMLLAPEERLPDGSYLASQPTRAIDTALHGSVEQPLRLPQPRLRWITMPHRLLYPDSLRFAAAAVPLSVEVTAPPIRKPTV